MRRATSRNLNRSSRRPMMVANGSNGISHHNSSNMRPKDMLPTVQKGSKMTAEDLNAWKCFHCGIDGNSTPSIRRGPDGGKVCFERKSYILKNLILINYIFIFIRHCVMLVAWFG